MSPQSQIGGEPETLEPPWQELHVLWTQLLQEDEDAPRDIRFQLNFNGTWTTMNTNPKFQFKIWAMTVQTDMSLNSIHVTKNHHPGTVPLTI